MPGRVITFAQSLCQVQQGRSRGCGRLCSHAVSTVAIGQRRNHRGQGRAGGAVADRRSAPAKGEPRHFAYQGEVQDALSLFFQLALSAPLPEGQHAYLVFNGKKLRNYIYEVRGEEILETALGALRTLHLARVTDSDGRFEAWLAVDRHYLPVRVLRSDDRGNTMELVVQSITP